MKYLCVPPLDDGATAGDFLQRQFPDLPAGHLGQLLKRGKFRCGGAPLGAQSVLSGNDLLILPGGATFQQRIAAGAPAILDEWDQGLIVNKPALLAVHAGLGHPDHLLGRLAAVMKQRHAPYRLHAVHRLDRETSGGLLLAKGRAAAGAYGRLFMDGAVGKSYLALVHGHPPDNGELREPLPVKGKIKSVATGFDTLQRRGAYSLLRIQLHSGRTHQIRRHLAAAGHPLVGDDRYGGRSPYCARTFLHCRELSFSEPTGNQPRTVSAPLPEELLATLLRCGFEPCAEIPELAPFRAVAGDDFSSSTREGRMSALPERIH